IIAYRTATEKSTRVQLARELEQMIFDQASFIPTFKVPYTREGFWRWLRLPEWHATRSSQTVFEPFGETGGLFWIDEEEKDNVQRARLLKEPFEAIEIVDQTWRSRAPQEAAP